MGTSPRIGTFVRALVTSSWSNPPIARVSPLLISTFESSERVSMIGLATVPPLPPGMLKSWSPTLLLISGLTASVMKLFLKGPKTR